MPTKRMREVSEQLGVSSQTVRNYLKLGPEYFSERATHPSRKRFTAEDVVTLRVIRDHLANGLTYDDIPDRLTPAAPRVIDHGQTIGREDHEPDPEPDQPTKRDQQQTTDLAIQYEPIIAAQQQTIMSKNEFIEELKTDKDRLQREVDQLKEDLDRSKRPWWSRLFGNSPE